MSFFEIIRTFLFTLPLGIFLTIGLFTVVTISMKVRRLDLVLRRIVLFYSLSAIVASLLLLLYCFEPAVFARLDVLYCAAVIFAMVSFHHFLCFAIGKPFSPIHYIIPALICGGMQILKLLLPDVWESEGICFSLTIALMFGIAYSLLPFLTMNNYYMHLAQSHGASVIDKKTSLRFIVEVLLFPIVFIVVPLVSGPEPGVLSSILLMMSILLALVMNIPLVYRIIRHYTSPLPATSLFAPDLIKEAYGQTAIKQKEPEQRSESETEPETDAGKRINKKYTKKNYTAGQLIELNRKEFEEYMKMHKPYRKHDLTIVELAEMLDTNRTYLSRFVNHTYGMTFSSYLNLCRLRDMEHLLGSPGNRDMIMAELAKRVGFVTGRNYMRAKKLFAANNGYTGVRIKHTGQQANAKKAKP